ncbi:MAG: septation protein IspZ [Rubrivivax sp.]|nr:septation protein IspZ [Rubrivivax sp.]
MSTVPPLQTPAPPLSEEALQQQRWDRNKPSIYADLGLGLLFFVVAKLSDLTTAALVAAGAGLALVVAQRFVKVDLLGGMALFGVFMLLVSAGFSWYFQDENLIKYKGTILGLFVATLMLSDAAFNRGRWFGRRLERYIQHPVDIRRLTLGLGLVGLTMAALNAGVARFASTDLWLNYTTFGDIIISITLFFGVLRFARLPAPAA